MTSTYMVEATRDAKCSVECSLNARSLTFRVTLCCDEPGSRPGPPLSEGAQRALHLSGSPLRLPSFGCLCINEQLEFLHALLVYGLLLSNLWIFLFHLTLTDSTDFLRSSSTFTRRSGAGRAPMSRSIFQSSPSPAEAGQAEPQCLGRSFKIPLHPPKRSRPSPNVSADPSKFPFTRRSGVRAPMSRSILQVLLHPPKRSRPSPNVSVVPSKFPFTRRSGAGRANLPLHAEARQTAQEEPGQLITEFLELGQFVLLLGAALRELLVAIRLQAGIRRRLIFQPHAHVADQSLLPRQKKRESSPWLTSTYMVEATRDAKCSNPVECSFNARSLNFLTASNLNRPPCHDKIERDHPPGLCKRLQLLTLTPCGGLEFRGLRLAILLGVCECRCPLRVCLP